MTLTLVHGGLIAVLRHSIVERLKNTTMCEQVMPNGAMRMQAFLQAFTARDVNRQDLRKHLVNSALIHPKAPEGRLTQVLKKN